MDGDEREEELGSLAAIYPELVVDAPYHASIDICVSPQEAIEVSFQNLSEPLTPPHSFDEKTDEPGLARTVTDVSNNKLNNIRYLPPLQVKAELQPNYPTAEPPRVSLTSSWLPIGHLQKLEMVCASLWDEYGRCQILFSYLDHLQQAADRLFDLPTPLVLPLSLRESMVEFNMQSEKQIFHKGTFDCGICLEPKKGNVCHRMEQCDHVFCRPCLQDFYQNAITEGDVATVECLDPECGKSGRKGRKTLHPRELLAIGIAEPTARRYVEMKRKKKAESKKSTIYCPRTWCQAPARRHSDQPIPFDLTQYPDSEADDQDEPENASQQTSNTTPKAASGADRIEVCSKCNFAFCSVCYLGWHGEFARCFPRDPQELSKEEQASYDYMRLHTSLCPSCNSAAQKSMGCNHMICYTCKTHFCYLCGAWLDPSDPYKHFNTYSKSATCYMRLWELEEGDDGQGRNVFVGARALEAEAIALAQQVGQDDGAAVRGAAAGPELILPEGFDLGEALLAEQVHVPHAVPGGGQAFDIVDALDELVVQDAQLAPDAAEVDDGPNRGRGRERGRNNGRRGRRGGRQANFVPGEARGGAHRFDAAVRNARANDARNGGQRHQRQGRDAGRHGAGHAVAGAVNGGAVRDLEDRDREAMRRFVEMAQRDEEDAWDSDEVEGDDEQWRIW